MKRFLVVLALLSSTQAFAQSKTPGFFKRLELGYTFVFDKATLSESYPIERNDPPRLDPIIKDTTIYTNLKPKGAIGGLIGSSIPIARLGKVSMLAFTVHASVNMITWDYKDDQPKNTTVTSPNTPNAKVETQEITASTMQAGLPLGFDMKFGCDAVVDKSYRYCGSFGVGATPTYVATELNGLSNSELLVRPYLRAEAGIFGGMCFKLRAQYNFGTISYLTTVKEQPANLRVFNNTTTLSGSSSFNLSLIIMPFAMSWDADRWWK